MNRARRQRITRLVLTALTVLNVWNGSRAFQQDDENFSSSASSRPSSSDSFFVLCWTDGTVMTVDSRTGRFLSQVAEAPLLQRSSSDSSPGAQDLAVILPGLDGRLYYWQRQHRLDENDDASGEDGQLEVLPITLASLLQHPVKSCPAGDNEDAAADCGILTAKTETSLLAVASETGKFVWHSAAETTPNPAKSSKEHETLVLQRRDYWIQHVSTSSGKQLWNATLGTYQALDFGTSAATSTSSPPLDDDGEEDNDTPEWLPGSNEKRSIKDVVLPSIVFKDGGHTIMALDPNSHSILWKQEASSVLASVFGVCNGEWKSVVVLEDAHGVDDDSTTSMERPPHRFRPRELGASNVGGGSWDYNLDYGELWTRHYHRQEQLERRHRRDQTGAFGKKQKQLPSPEHVCLDGECESPYHHQFSKEQLRLPAPKVVQPDGILLSWKHVAIILIVLVNAVVGFRIWYYSKKRKWAADEVRRRLLESDNTTEDSNRHVLKRSMSLPGVLTTDQLTPLPVHSEPGQVQVAPDAAATQHAGVPLVQYSRYESEFEEIESLGKGGFGSVFRCKNVLDGRGYAIKKVSIRGATSDEAFKRRLERVLREVKILAVLDHPNIVRYYTAWLEMEKKDCSADCSSIDDDANSSRCYSSSYLTEGSSRWQSSPTGRRRVSSWKSDTSDEPSWRVHGTFPRAYSADDLGLIFEESKEEELSSKSRSASREDLQQNPASTIGPTTENTRISVPNTSKRSTNDQMEFSSKESEISNVRHTLYIQMQLCSQKTVGDFLSDENARKGSSSTAVDVPAALRLFLQIAQAVTYVHQQGLIHRDLKPSNCFMDESGTIKVGDFGLSRESGAERIAKEHSSSSQLLSGMDDHTAGVGTRSYASPEQMNGSDYDASTDVYSLGIILFELCYPMYTGMERGICLTKLRDCVFPNDWERQVGKSFPTLQSLLQSMLSTSPGVRPTAASVVEHIQNLLGDLKILSLDHHDPETILLSVEAEHREDALGHTMKLIRQVADSPVDIVQYGLRSGTWNDSKPAAIMEFAINCADSNTGPMLVAKLQNRPEIYKARQISNGHRVDGKSAS